MAGVDAREWLGPTTDAVSIHMLFLVLLSFAASARCPAPRCWDEADTMFDRGFGPEMGTDVAPLRRRIAGPEAQKGGSPSRRSPQLGALSKQCL